MPGTPKRAPGASYKPDSRDVAVQPERESERSGVSLGNGRCFYLRLSLTSRRSLQGDCHKLKRKLNALCQQGQREDTLVRIACQELEAWYFGAPDVLAEAFGREDLRDISKKRKFRDPDSIVNPARALNKLVPEFQKISGARRMAKFLIRGNSSHSFEVFVGGIDRVADAMQSELKKLGRV